MPRPIHSSTKYVPALDGIRVMWPTAATGRPSNAFPAGVETADIPKDAEVSSEGPK
ncbi:hypothetical protein [Corynebacterium sp. p3-SID1056]|uniref:hypothetical protein n=1 Tax=Corynebacterium sp. p3-SID1056 TaxID=2916092 RepID=UPI0021A5717D|nr:hypothetical protein [Corynebacterium sp. p3-SID1056]MCT2339010.1 hypothetical protein [Corynebacterium sp. p3-SID1056]